MKRRSNYRRAVYKKRKAVYAINSKIRPQRLIEKHFLTPDPLVEGHISLKQTPSTNSVVSNAQENEDSIEVLRRTPGGGHESSIYEPQQASLTYMDGCFLKECSKGPPECSTPIPNEFFHRDFSRMRKPLDEHFGKVTPIMGADLETSSSFTPVHHCTTPPRTSTPIQQQNPPPKMTSLGMDSTFQKMMDFDEIGFQASEEFPSLKPETVPVVTDDKASHALTATTDHPKHTDHHSNSISLSQQSTASNVRHTNKRTTSESRVSQLMSKSQRTSAKGTETCTTINKNSCMQHKDNASGTVYPTCVLVSLARLQRLSTSRVCPPQHKSISTHYHHDLPKDILIL